jgi:hypothetical protein
MNNANKRLPYTFQEALGYNGRKVDEKKALQILERVGIDAISDLDETPLEVAASLCNITILKNIIERYKQTEANIAQILGEALVKSSDQRKLDCIKILVEEGADLEQTDRFNLTPLARVFTNTFSDPIPSATFLIGQGAKITEDFIEMGMNWNSEKFITFLESQNIAFNKNLIPEREIVETKKTDTILDIVNLHNVINRKDYHKTAKVMWQRLVLKSGQVDTIQGELLRAIEKLRDEAQRNGNANFNKDHHGAFIAYLKKYLLDENIFDKETLAEIKKDLKQISFKSIPYLKDDIYDKIVERIIDWYLENPNPIPHNKNHI